MWNDFSNHFKKKDRTKTPMNHHDFLLQNKIDN